jgi:N-acetylglucosaminyl-diphospho-decaprenol L-rhamnosyltransferase
VCSAYAVAVVHYKSIDLVSRLLNSIRTQTELPRKVVIVDNSMDLDPIAVARSAGELPFELIRLPNPGYGAAVNRARQAVGADADHILVLTQDVVLLPDTVDSMLKVMDDEPAAGCVGPALYRTSPRSQVFSYGGRLGFGGETIHLNDAKRNSPYAVDWIDGAVMLIRLEAFDIVGGFDERFFLYFEEVDLAYRMRDCGLTIVVDPAATAFQEPGNYTPYLRFRNHLLFARSRYPGYKVLCALLLKLVRSIPGWIKRRQFTAPAWGVRGTLDGMRQRGGSPPRGVFASATTNSDVSI